MTGSVSQQGDIQPIGGVNQKIEGFFDVCRVKTGLTGRQGVMIPAENIEDLMLRDDVIEAVAAGKFHILPVSTLEEGIEILTGVKAGRRDANGMFEPTPSTRWWTAASTKWPTPSRHSNALGFARTVSADLREKPSTDWKPDPDSCYRAVAVPTSFGVER